jgi:hypothetical protein
MDAVSRALFEILALSLLVPHIDMLPQLEAEEDMHDEKEVVALTLFDSK